MKILQALLTASRLLPRKLAATLAMVAALTGLSAVYSAPALAILSCEAGAGPTVSGGSGDSCGLNKYQASANSNVAGPGVAYFGSASVLPSTGAQSGRISLSDNLQDGLGPPLANGNFYSNLLVDFRITGPASAVAVPVTVLSSVTGGIADNCVNCDASISYLFRLDHPALQVQLTAGRTRGSDWVTNKTTVGADGDVSSTAQGFGGAFTFNAASLLFQPIRLTSNLSGTVALTNANPEGAAISADASNTALFNVIVPAGYSVVAEPSFVPLLTNPVLLVPEPEPVALLTVGLIALVAGVRRGAVRGQAFVPHAPSERGPTL